MSYGIVRRRHLFVYFGQVYLRGRSRKRESSFVRLPCKTAFNPRHRPGKAKWKSHGELNSRFAA